MFFSAPVTFQSRRSEGVAEWMQNGKAEPEAVQMYCERLCFFIAKNSIVPYKYKPL
jgi:hypothetical protein